MTAPDGFILNFPDAEHFAHTCPPVVGIFWVVYIGSSIVSVVIGLLAFLITLRIDPLSAEWFADNSFYSISGLFLFC